MVVAIRVREALTGRKPWRRRWIVVMRFVAVFRVLVTLVVRVPVLVMVRVVVTVPVVVAVRSVNVSRRGVRVAVSEVNVGRLGDDAEGGNEHATQDGQARSHQGENNPALIAGATRSEIPDFPRGPWPFETRHRLPLSEYPLWLPISSLRTHIEIRCT